MVAMTSLGIDKLYKEQSENPHNSQKHQIHRAVGDTDQLVTGGTEQSTHTWCWALQDSTAAFQGVQPPEKVPKQHNGFTKMCKAAHYFMSTSVLLEAMK